MSSSSVEESVYLIGGSDAIRAQLAETFGGDVRIGLPERPVDAGWLFVDAVSPRGVETLEEMSPFSACRSFKDLGCARVFLLISASDPYAAEIARFCLADGCLLVGRDGRIMDFESMRHFMERKRPKASVDNLLEKLEREIAGNETRRASALQRMLDARPEDGLLGTLTDPETGLFDGPFAMFKLDEEFKRAMRFNQALSLILLDCGVDELPDDSHGRRTVLAEMASIFLVECRDIDVLARFTETVFLFLLPGTGAAGATTAARRMMDGLRSREFAVPLQIEPAVGIATVPMAGIADRRSFLARAEACLELARQGRGREGLYLAAP